MFYYVDYGNLNQDLYLYYNVFRLHTLQIYFYSTKFRRSQVLAVYVGMFLLCTVAP